MALIHIKQWPQPIEAGRLRILEAALDAGVPYPHGCGTGECGSCKSQLICGDITMDRYSPDALSDAERERGLILACRTRLVGDATVRWLSTTAPQPMVKLDARVFAIFRVAHDVMVLTLSLPAGQKLDFRPGQFAKLRFGKLPARSYSMASQPENGLLEFHIRTVPNGLVSSYVAQRLEMGEKVEVRGPFGDAHWDEELGRAAQPLLLLAGGTGMAPIVSVLDAALRQGVAGRQIHVYHGVRSEQDLYTGSQMAARAKEHGFRFVPVYSERAVGGARSGFLHDALAEDFQSLMGTVIYVAGPPPMVEAVKTVAIGRGADAERMRSDPFFAAVPEKKSLWERITAFGDL